MVMNAESISKPTPPTHRETSVAEIETALTGFWATALALETVGRDQNFFELGGQSLAAMALLEKASEFFAVPMPFTVIFKHPTIRDMAHWLERCLAEEASDATGAE